MRIPVQTRKGVCPQSTWKRTTYLELEILDFTINVLREDITGMSALLQCHLGLHLESIAVLLDLPLKQIEVGIKVCLHGIYVRTKSQLKIMWHARLDAPSSVKAPVQSEASSRKKRSKGAEK